VKEEEKRIQENNRGWEEKRTKGGEDWRERIEGKREGE
jgi:hypothetical protein